MIWRVRPRTIEGVTRVRTALSLGLLAAAAAVLAPACSLGAGTGTCSGTLDVPDCWSGDFDLHPNFFAAVPATTPEFPTFTSDSLRIRIQNGGDYETFSDGLIILVNDVGQVRGDPRRTARRDRVFWASR